MASTIQVSVEQMVGCWLQIQSVFCELILVFIRYIQIITQFFAFDIKGGASSDLLPQLLLSLSPIFNTSLLP